MPSEILNKARAYEAEHGAAISPAERPAYHMTPYVGWLNDPNGFSYYKGKYHQFYQYNPYDVRWAPMHWGHAVSTDLLHWEYLPCALAPDSPADNGPGCFSGSATQMDDGKQLLMYTSVIAEKQPNGEMRDIQTQSIAIGDGLNYEKPACNPVLTQKDLPEGFSKFDFRDPKIWREADGTYSAVTACAGGTNAVGDAFHYIRDGYAEVMLCGGTEASITPMSIGGFTSMKALTQTEDPDRASIPFDAERSGFVMGEGAGVLLLEELEHAKTRGAKIYAEVVGYGATCDAHHITAPLADGSGGAKAMAMALTDGGVSPEQVGYINAHGTSTHLNDAGETAAVKTVFGPHAYQLAMSSTKSMTGHMLGAAGAVEAIFTALSLRDGFLPATIHYQTPDPDCDLDVVPNEGRPADIRYALSNSLGFGGHNGSLLLKKWED